MRRRWLCLVFLLALAAAFPAAAAAETAGDFEVTGGTVGTDYTFDNDTRVLTVKNGANITIAMAAGKTQTTDHIEVEADATATVTLSGVHIEVGGSPALAVLGGSGTTTIVLADGTGNYLQGSSGIEKGDDVGTLLITCASAHGSGHACTTMCGQLTARSSGGAAIGSGSGKNARNITINGGQIEAIGTGYGAGIGGGSSYSTGGDAENITINGGVIKAGGAGGAAGIGGGGYGGGVKGITINGGQITASSEERAAAIGGGNRGSAENITITNGTVNATGGVGIGGRALPSATVTITGGTVTAQAGDSTAPAIKGTPDFEDYVHRTYGNSTANTDSEDLVEWTGNPAADWSIWHWVKIEPVALTEAHTVTFQDRTETRTVTALAGKTFAAPTEPTRAGYAFDGWYQNSDYSGAAWDFDKDTMPAGNLTLYAKWTAIEYTVTFSLDGDTRTVPPETVATDSRITPPSVAARPGYTLDGWYQSSDYSGAKWDFATGTMPPRDLTLYARWTANEQTVTFVAGGGSPAPGAQTVPTDGRVSEPAPAPARAGYTFDGWYQSSDYSGAAWDFATDTMPPHALTLYAKWIAQEQTVTFSLDGDTAAVPPVKVKTDQLIPAPAVERPGYTLDGWYQRDDYSGAKWDFARDPMPPGSLTLYARWRVNRYTVTFYVDGGSAVAPVQVDMGDLVPEPITPTRTGYRFSGWCLGDGTPWDFARDRMPPRDLKLYAHWSRLTVPLTGDAGTGLWWALLLGSGLGMATLRTAARRARGPKHF